MANRRRTIHQHHLIMVYKEVINLLHVALVLLVQEWIQSLDERVANEDHIFVDVKAVSHSSLDSARYTMAFEIAIDEATLATSKQIEDFIHANLVVFVNLLVVRHEIVRDSVSISLEEELILLDSLDVLENVN